MQAESNYTSIYNAKQMVLEELGERGKQRYSRLLLNTHLPENVFDKAVELLIDENLINRTGEEDDPAFELVRRRWNWLENLIGVRR
ncbi:MAG: hypothetical protein JMDDDDMK_02813 [Acidobacteria bacterium]|nr:hypothetical protein [Acidobacteriota bacterium]